MTKDDKVNPFKIVLVGDSVTGKSSLLSRLLKDQVDTKYTPTTGLVNETYHLLVDNKTVEIDIWDIGGQEKYRGVTKSCFHDANGILLVFDVSNPTSFENLIGWLKDIIEVADQKTVIKLVGNKNDLNDQHVVPMDKIESFTSKYGLSFTKTSALGDCSSVNEIFQELYVMIHSLLDNSGDDYPFSTCGFISKCIKNKDHVENLIPDASYKDTQPQEQEKPSFYVVLVDIKKASDVVNEKIHCVKKQLYDDDLKYVAISYRWGELHETLINTHVGYTAKITSFDLKHFFDLCRTMTLEKDTQDIDYVWVDAICVDQTNYERRKATIYQMSNIYERAQYILAVPDLNKAHLKNTSTMYEKIMRKSCEYRHDLYHLIHNNIHELTSIENKWLDSFEVPNDPGLRQLLRLSTNHFTNTFMNHRKYYNGYIAEASLDHIYETSQHRPFDNNDNVSDAKFQHHQPHHCHQRECPVDLFHLYQLPEYKIQKCDGGLYEHQFRTCWKQLIQERNNSIRRSMNFLKDLIKDWSTRVWVISEYNIAKKKNNLKYWFIQLKDVAYDLEEEFVFFNFDFQDDVFPTTIQQAFISDNPHTDDYDDNDPVYLTFHQTMITQLNQQSFLEMMLKSKASKNEDRFYAIFPLTDHKDMITNKGEMEKWKFDSLTSVKLKLYQIMNTSDKLTLLFLSWNGDNLNIGNVMPTFATSPIIWYGSKLEHFTMKDIDKSDYNFDLHSDSTITLCESNSNNDINSKQFYLKVKPKEYYICTGGEYLDYFIDTAVWNKLQPVQNHLKTLCHVGISSIKEKAIVAHNRGSGSDRRQLKSHHICLVGNFEKNIWTITRTSPVADFDYRRCDDNSPGFNIY